MLSIKSIKWGAADSPTSGQGDQLQQMVNTRNWPVITVIEINITNNTILYTIHHIVVSSDHNCSSPGTSLQRNCSILRA